MLEQVRCNHIRWLWMGGHGRWVEGGGLVFTAEEHPPHPPPCPGVSPQGGAGGVPCLRCGAVASIHNRGWLHQRHFDGVVTPSSGRGSSTPGEKCGVGGDCPRHVPLPGFPACHLDRNSAADGWHPGFLLPLLVFVTLKWPVII